MRITGPGGLIVIRTLFTYRYHPLPADYWRFTAKGLDLLFHQTGQVESLVGGYDIRARRRDARGHHDWRVLWVGRRLG